MKPESNDDNASLGTKESLLDAAEALFAEHGVAGASIRAITTRAGVNVAAAHYHFGSKIALLRAVLARRLAPVNEARVEQLKRYLAQDPSARRLADLVRAFVGPVVTHGRQLPDGGRAFAQLFSRAMTAPDATLRVVLIGELDDVIRRFLPAFADALPALDVEALTWRIHFTVGAMANTMAGTGMLEAITGDLCDLADLDATVEHLVAYATAGLEAPPPS